MVSPAQSTSTPNSVPAPMPGNVSYSTEKPTGTTIIIQTGFGQTRR